MKNYSVFISWHNTIKALCSICFSLLWDLLLLIPSTVGIRSVTNWCRLFCIEVQFSCSAVSDSVTPWIASRQASLSITNSWSLLKLKFVESVMPSSHLLLCCPILLLPPVPPSIRVFSSESALHEVAKVKT